MLALAVILTVLAIPLVAQQGDVAGQEQPPFPSSLVIPRATPLGWEEELATFELPAGSSIELVVAEPLVHDPVR